MSEQANKKSVGRPTGKSDAREQLILRARELFISMPYDKVSTRLVAEKAGVNSAMIRYYFGNKEGLFETMVRETMEPIRHNIQEMRKRHDQVSLLDIMSMHMNQMRQMPDFPKLVFQSMHMPASAVQRQLMVKVFSEMMDTDHHRIFAKMSKSALLREGLDPKMARLSVISLLMFPFLAPAPMLELHGIELDDEFLEGYLSHNIDLITKGFMKPGATID
ncbi:TetR family transcriptional regulator [Vibrio sp. qd031]|uniref:TetR/AcrR family transcriptional regulator n=1 Tax=Vibrio sp. qd031 TaxID=1603038 RepID=UPI000A257F83|nr:TetR/AcrR family transcriptional regulator [Vibrio sp. qd031]ORT48226.1 TetR family transcriptional regulator [Vibrio sp. qd031]